MGVFPRLYKGERRLRFRSTSESKVIIVLILLPLFLLGRAHFATAAELYSDGFESGDKTAFDGTVESNPTPAPD